jgi:hypothetical protein
MFYSHAIDTYTMTSLPILISFDEFSRLFADAIDEYGIANYNLPSLYLKYKYFNHEDAKQALKQCFSSFSSSNSSDSQHNNTIHQANPTTLVPQIKKSEYIKCMATQFYAADKHVHVHVPTLVLDKSSTLHLLVFERRTSMIGASTVCTDKISISQDITPKEANQKLYMDLVEAFANLAASPLLPSFEIIHKDFVIITCKDNLALPRLALPSFIDTISAKIRCESKDELIVVPFSKEVIMATKSSSYLGCCLLGDYADATDALEVADHNTSRPYRIHTIHRQSSLDSLLSTGT